MPWAGLLYVLTSMFVRRNMMRLRSLRRAEEGSSQKPTRRAPAFMLSACLHNNPCIPFYHALSAELAGVARTILTCQQAVPGISAAAFVRAPTLGCRLDEFGRPKKRHGSGDDRRSREEAALARLHGGSNQVPLSSSGMLSSNVVGIFNVGTSGLPVWVFNLCGFIGLLGVNLFVNVNALSTNISPCSCCRSSGGHWQSGVLLR